MSSFKRILKPQKVHRERQQLASRANLGPMEKKKDYKVRAKDQELHKKTIKNLYKKSQNANPDEFQYHMKNSHLQDGVHFENVEGRELCVDDVNKDLLYVMHKRTNEKKKIEKLKAELQILDPESHKDISGAKKPKHIIFVDSKKEGKKANLAELLDTHPSLVDKPLNRLKKSQLAEISFDDLRSKDIKEISKIRKEAYKMLSRRITRENKLRILEEKLRVRKNVMCHKQGDSIPQVVKAGTPTQAPIYKWAEERRR